MDTPTTTPPRAPAVHPAPRHIAMILRPLYSRIVRVRSLLDLPPDVLASEPTQPSANAGVFQIEPQPELYDVLYPAALVAEADRTAKAEPATVAEARDLIRDPRAALDAPELHRHVAWLVAGADLRHRRASAATGGRTVA
ncbi:hypothetical protein [Paracoccus chinensis]|uniref:Uncharacterized protein n=1 Tax=Paracoccus chinensis TaxID=525640 RepID=A0A1G9JH93_9RHOB|nr:hypothetical protein [Paracoccus chinensis]SDL36503.1 hypothetical protein SAMN04487971_109122 [Paracoccus chinensis]